MAPDVPGVHDTPERRAAARKGVRAAASERSERAGTLVLGACASRPSENQHAALRFRLSQYLDEAGDATPVGSPAEHVQDLVRILKGWHRKAFASAQPEALILPRKFSELILRPHSIASAGREAWRLTFQAFTTPRSRASARRSGVRGAASERSECSVNARVRRWSGRVSTAQAHSSALGLLPLHNDPSRIACTHMAQIPPDVGYREIDSWRRWPGRAENVPGR